MNIVVAGEGAFGQQHLQALAQIEGVKVVGLVGGDLIATQLCASRFRIPHYTLSLAEMANRADVDAFILATPTPMHTAQTLQCLNAGKHVQVEIPMADNLADARTIVQTAQSSGLVAAVGHTRRFNAPHRWLHRRMASGALTLQQMDVQTFFFRRTNTNALGEVRGWTDNLLWHHACHTVDLFQHQTGEIASVARAVQGPVHKELGIPMDMSVQMKSPSGALCTLCLSFNNEGPHGTTFRYICDQGTFVVSYDDLVDGGGRPIDMSPHLFTANGVLTQDQNFVDAIRNGSEPVASVKNVLPAYETLDRIRASLI